jgi:hypothetical protein
VTEIQIVTSSKFSYFRPYLFLATGLTFFVSLSGLAQDESPLPGNSTDIVNVNSNPASTASAMAPIPGNNQSTHALNISPNGQTLSKPHSDSHSSETFTGPVSLSDLQTSVEDLKNSSATEESLNKYIAGLDVLIKAHNKLAATFSRQENTVAAGNGERNLSKQLCLLKDKVLYLKAQILIKENRLCEAVSILADITSFEPSSALGQQCYKHLIEMDFSVKTEDVIAKTTSTNSLTQSSKIKRQVGILAR